MTLHEALVTALDDEFRARATYQAVVDHYGSVRPFIEIVVAEQRHIAALAHLFTRYGLPLPGDRWSGNIILNGSLQAECTAAIAGEIGNYQMYDRLLSQVSVPDVRQVFTNLRNASAYNHLPAFQACADVIQPQPNGMAENPLDRGSQQSGNVLITLGAGLIAGAGLIWLLSRRKYPSTVQG